MSLQDELVIAFAVLDLIFLIILGVVGLRFLSLATQASRTVRPVVERGRRIAVTGRRLAETARSRGETILQILKALGRDTSAKLETTRRIVTEVVHPDTGSLDSVARTVEQGQAWSARLHRLGAAARRAAAQNGHGRRPV